MDGFLSMLELQSVLLLYLLVGILCKKISIITKQNEQNFINLVIYICMPCMVFNSFKSITVAMLLQAFNVFAVSMAVCALAWALGRVLYRRYPQAMQGPLRYGTLISNCGFAGLPLAEQAFGDIGLIYASVYLIPIRFFMWSAGVTMLSGEKRPLAEVVKKLATNPCVIAIFVGLARGLLGIDLPTPVETVVSGLSACVSPLSMIVVGAIVADVEPRTVFSMPVFFFCGVRLVAMPLITFGLCTLLGLDATITGTCILMAAMPAATTTTLLSVQFGADAEFAAKLVCLSTVLSIVTTPFFMLLL